MTQSWLGVYFATNKLNPYLNTCRYSFVVLCARYQVTNLICSNSCLIYESSSTTFTTSLAEESSFVIGYYSLNHYGLID